MVFGKQPRGTTKAIMKCSGTINNLIEEALPKYLGKQLFSKTAAALNATCLSEHYEDVLLTHSCYILHAEESLPSTLRNEL